MQCWSEPMKPRTVSVRAGNGERESQSVSDVAVFYGSVSKSIASSHLELRVVCPLQICDEHVSNTALDHFIDWWVFLCSS